MNGPMPAAVHAAPTREAVLAALLQLEQRARACTDEEELAFLMVNETHALVPYRQAVLWLGDAHGGRIHALSGLAVPDANAPFNVWLAALLARVPLAGPAPLGPDGIGTGDASMWQEHLPRHGWALPLSLMATGPGTADGRTAALLLCRETPWQPGETAILALLADSYAHAWRALRLARRNQRASGPLWQRVRTLARKRRVWLGAAAAATVLLCVPVRQSVLAPAEIVARAPEAVRAPLQGVVDRIVVQPNQAVKVGDLLAALDARELEGRLESTRQALAVADAELRQGQQQALFDERSKATLGVLQGKRDQAAADTDYLTKALARTQLRAERAGTAIFDDPADWVGKPVVPGERIMLVADPRDIQLEVQLPVADAIALPPGGRVQLFLNTAPATPLAATLERVGYRASPTAEGTLAYRVRARFAPGVGEDSAARIGLKGTAKLYGERTPLAAYLLRRPLATLRVWLGV